MAARNRLDPVVRLEEHRETRSLQALAAANRQAMAAQKALEHARDHANQDHRAAGAASLWDVADAAHANARRVVIEAERAAQTAAHAQGHSRKAYISAHARAEAIRRVATSRREDKLREEHRASEREIQDLQLMRRHARAG